MSQKRLFFMALFSLVFLVGGLLAASLGASLGFREFSEAEQGLYMLLLPCCGLPLVVTGSTVTILLSQSKAPNDQTFIRMCALGLIATLLLTFGITLILSTLLA